MNKGADSSSVSYNGVEKDTVVTLKGGSNPEQNREERQLASQLGYHHCKDRKI